MRAHHTPCPCHRQRFHAHVVRRRSSTTDLEFRGGAHRRNPRRRCLSAHGSDPGLSGTRTALGENLVLVRLVCPLARSVPRVSYLKGIVVVVGRRWLDGACSQLGFQGAVRRLERRDAVREGCRLQCKRMLECCARRLDTWCHKDSARRKKQRVSRLPVSRGSLFKWPNSDLLWARASADAAFSALSASLACWSSRCGRTAILGRQPEAAHSSSRAGARLT